LAKAAPVILAISLSIQILEHVGWLDRFETASIDAFNILQPPHDPSYVIVVGINDDDYHSLFGGVSPLDYRKLQNVLAAIAGGHPRVIGIDLDTSWEGFQKIRVPKEWPSLVWGQDATQVGRELRPIPILGGQDKQVLRPSDGKGLAGLPEDSDGVIRRYRREIVVNDGVVKSFPWAVIGVGCSSGSQECCRAITEKTETSATSLLLNFSGERFNFSPVSARHVLMVSGEPAWGQNGIFKDKIVLVGGLYHEARDTHATPIGQMSGVQLMAQVIESELRHGGIQPFREYAALGLDLLLGTAVVFLHSFFRLRTALILNLLAIPVLSLVGSYVAFSSLSRWFNFVPVVIGVLIHELYDNAREYQRLVTSVQTEHTR